jgi:hypothetical protein
MSEVLFFIVTMVFVIAGMFIEIIVAKKAASIIQGIVLVFLLLENVVILVGAMGTMASDLPIPWKLGIALAWGFVCVGIESTLFTVRDHHLAIKKIDRLERQVRLLMTIDGKK